MKLAKGYLATHIKPGPTYWYWIKNKGYWLSNIVPMDYGNTNWVKDINAAHLFKELDHETMPNI